MKRTMEKIVSILEQDVPDEHIEFLPQSKVRENSNTHAFEVLAVPYVTIDFIRQRLDDACGPFGWQTEAKEVNGLTFAGIGILNPDSGEWVWKWDTGQDRPWSSSDLEEDEDGGAAMAGGQMTARGTFSICIKRCAYQWAIGKNVRNLRCYYHPCSTRQVRGKTKFGWWNGDPLDTIRSHNNGVMPTRAPASDLPSPDYEPDPAKGEVLYSGEEETAEPAVEPLAKPDENDYPTACKELGERLGMSRKDYGTFSSRFSTDGVLDWQALWDGLVEYREMVESIRADSSRLPTYAEVIKAIDDEPPF